MDDTCARRTKLEKNGKIFIPREYRKKPGLKSGDAFITYLEEARLRLYTPAQAAARAQALVRRYVPKGRGLSGELIFERREEAAHLP